MDAIPANTRHLNHPGNLGTKSDSSKAPATELERRAQQLAQMQENAKSSLPPGIPLHSMQQTPPTSTSSVFPVVANSTVMQATETAVHVENVELENHVSMQIFSSPQTQNNNKVVMFLHGGPGLNYDASFQPVTDWFVGNGYTLVAPEIAGSGKAGLKNMSNSHTQNYVRDLKAVIQSLRERPDMQGKEVCVVAHSWGGFQLASLMTDESAEERNFIKQAVFMSCNLDSAQTRLFQNASSYNEQTPNSLFNFERVIVCGFEERHTGYEEQMDESQRMTVTHNPLIDQTLNEKFSPFYRLEKMPQQTPFLFIHATDDGQVPVSQSVDAFQKINDAGGDARILIPSRGGHGFFKEGKSHHAETMAHCFGVMASFIRRPDAVNKVMIDDTILPEATASGIEERLRETNETYENAGKVLKDFHEGVETPRADGARKVPPKQTLLKKLAEAHEIFFKRFEGNATPAGVKARQTHELALSRIDQALRKDE